MDEESRAEALRTLEEMVLDAGEAVSYRQLASTLCLHVNRSKALLQEFVDKHATDHGLSVSMLVCGLSSNGGARTLLCPRADLDTVRASLNPVQFEHVYAVSRASAALEGATLAAAAGDFEDFTPTIGAVASSVCAKRSQQEIGSLKINSYKSLTNDTATPSRVANKNFQNKESSAPNMDQKVADGSAPTAKPTSSIIRSDSCTSKSTKETSPESAVKTKESNSTSKGKSKSNISSFFSKPIGQQGAKQVSKIKEEPKYIKTEHKDVKAETMAVTSTNKVTNGNVKTEKNENTKAKNKKTVKIENKPSEKMEVKKDSTKKSVVSAQRHGKVDKKRKRVLHVSDSEDSDKDDPFEEASAANAEVEEDEDIIPATPNADVVKITSGIVNPKKRRKVVDKTYTTEDGYMVTRKEEVLESCSEEEVEMKENIVETNLKKEIIVEKKTPAAAPKSKKKMLSPQKGKQASIMSFFKKKP